MFSQEFYELREVNLMERETTHYLLRHPTVSGLDRLTIAAVSASAKKPTPMPISIPHVPATVDSLPSLYFERYPTILTLHLLKMTGSSPPILTHLIPFTSCRRYLVPRRHLMKIFSVPTTPGG